MLIRCPMCNKEISPNAISCPNCGEPMKQQEINKNIKDEIVGFDVYIRSISPNQKIKAIKLIRELTLCGLKEGKDIVDSAPILFLSNLSKEEVDNLKWFFKDIVIEFDIKPHSKDSRLTIKNNRLCNKTELNTSREEKSGIIIRFILFLLFIGCIVIAFKSCV